MNVRRATAVLKRQAYETWHTPAEIFELLYWPFFDLLAWGLLTSFIEQGDVNLPVPIAFLLGAALLWNILYRVQIGISLSFIGETWSDNVIALFASPITPGEYLTGAMMWTGVQMVVVWTVMTAGAWFAFSFGITSLGLALIPFLAALMLFGVAMSMFVLGVVLRVGHGANVIAWGLAGVVQPLSAVYYPLEILPGWAQAIGRALPPTHVFEGMRQVIAGGPAPVGALASAMALNVVYLLVGVWFARHMLTTMRERGYVTRYAS